MCIRSPILKAPHTVEAPQYLKKTPACFVDSKCSMIAMVSNQFEVQNNHDDAVKAYDIYARDGNL